MRSHLRAPSISPQPWLCHAAQHPPSSVLLRRLIGAVEVTEEQPWKLVTFCVQTVEDAADVSKRNKGEVLPDCPS